MAQTGPEYQTTVQISPLPDGRLLFARQPTMAQRLRQIIVPILWVLVGVAAVTLWSF